MSGTPYECYKNGELGIAMSWSDVGLACLAEEYNSYIKIVDIPLGGHLSGGRGNDVVTRVIVTPELFLIFMS